MIASQLRPSLRRTGYTRSLTAHVIVDVESGVTQDQP
jgi:hypothetical protein